MSNHFHLVLRSRPVVVAAWDDAEVARRWLMLCPLRRRADLQPEEPNEFELNSIRTDPRRLTEIRRRLSDVSWWMRLLSQKIGRRANREDQEVGKFWQARYRAVRLLDETAILACAAYVDLNPIRAAMAETIETSEYTSAQQRALELKYSQNGQEQEQPLSAKPIAASLSPLSLDESAGEIGSWVHVGGYRASDKGFLPMSVADYLELLDWTARQLRSDKRGSTPASARPLLERLGLEASAWCELTKNFGRLFSTVAGKPTVIETTRGRTRNQRYHIRARTRELLAAR